MIKTQSRYRKVFIFVLALFALFGITHKVFHLDYSYASTLPFYDDFSTNDDSAWTKYAPYGSWQILNNEFVGSAQDTPQKIFSYALAGDANWNNYSFQVRVYGESTVDKIILFYFQDDGSTYAVNVRSAYSGNKGNDILLIKRVGFTGVASEINTVPFNNTINTWYLVRVDIFNTTQDVQIDVYVDGILKIHRLDVGSTFRNGKIGLGVWPEGPATNRFDDVSVEPLLFSPTPTATPTPTITPTPTPTATPTATPAPTPTPTATPEVSLDVPNLKQYSPPWKNLEYDSASKWSLTPTIERWGCALTSATMVLRFFNHDILPDSLNTWLKNQRDGYIRNGLVNWLAITRFSRENANKISNGESLSVLEYSVIKNPTTENIINSLQQNIPPIIKLPGHFVTARGVDNPNVLINDPASLLFNLDSIVTQRGPVLAMNKFTPSNTDLSYLYFVIDKGFQLELSDLNGNSVGMTALDEEGLIDDTNPSSSESGGELNTFLLSKPPLTSYKLKVAGQGHYNLDFYFYDVNGVPFMESFQSSDTGLYYIHLNGTGSVVFKIDIDSFISKIDEYYKEGKIKNKNIYLVIRKQAEAARYLFLYRKYSLYKKQLLLLSKQIKSFTPKYIETNTSNSLQIFIKSLIDGA